MTRTALRDAQVIRYGTDTSGRPVYMTRRMARWFDGLQVETGLDLWVAQGAYMTRVGGGAAASAGYHDRGGCLDISVRNLDAHERTLVVRAARRGGAATWLRDQTHGGMDPHIHLVLDVDFDKPTEVAWQFDEYLAGRDGLSTRGKDYHWRPTPIVKTPPKGWGKRKRPKASRITPTLDA